MDDRQLEALHQWFDAYADKFSDSPGHLPHLLQLKLCHSRRVARDSRDIARDLGWQPERVRLAEAIGLLHDVGRFTQFREFGTFRDARSVDHGQRGAEVLKSEGPCDPLPADEAATIQTAVRFHNRKGLPADLPAEVMEMLKLIRDSDKLDIFFVLNDAIVSGALKKHPDITLNVKLDGPASPGFLAAVRSGRLPSYEDMKSLADMNLLQLVWLHEIHYRPTYQRIAERKVIDRIAAVLPQAPECAQAVTVARQVLSGKLANGKHS